MTSKKKSDSISIPTDRKGNVKKSYLKEVNGRRSPVAQRMDARKTSKNVIEPPVKQSDAEKWIKNPGKMDIRGIDTPDEPVKKTVKKASAPKKTTVRKAEVKPKKTVKKTPVKKKTTDAKKPTKKASVKQSESESKKIPIVRPRRKRKQPVRSKMEYSADWYDNLPWDTDPETASRMAAEALSIEKIENTDDMLAYLKDSGYGEKAENSRWKYDERDMAIAYQHEKWDEVRMEMGMLNRKPTKLNRGTLRRVSDGEYELIFTSNKYIDGRFKSIYTLTRQSDYWYLSYCSSESYYTDGSLDSEGLEAFSIGSWGTIYTPDGFPENRFRTLTELTSLIDSREDVFL